MDKILNTPTLRRGIGSRVRRVAVPGVTALLVASLGLGVSLSRQTPSMAAGISHIAGVITVAPTATAAGPASFQLRRLNGATATVNVSATTRILRRFNGPTDVTALSLNDRLSLTGTFEAGNTIFDATQIKDLSIQQADAYARGTVASVNAAANSFVFRVTVAPRNSPLGGDITVVLAANQAIALPNGSTETIANLRPNDTIFARGVYDRNSHTLSHIDAVRVTRLATQPTGQSVSFQISGYASYQNHYAVVRIHTAANVRVHVVLHVNGRTIQVNGQTGANGTFQAQRMIGRGRWPSAHVVRGSAYVYLPESVTISTSVFIV